MSKLLSIFIILAGSIFLPLVQGAGSAVEATPTATATVTEEVVYPTITLTPSATPTATPEIVYPTVTMTPTATPEAYPLAITEFFPGAGWLEEHIIIRYYGTDPLNLEGFSVRVFNEASGDTVIQAAFDKGSLLYTGERLALYTAGTDPSKFDNRRISSMRATFTVFGDYDGGNCIELWSPYKLQLIDMACP